MSRVPDPGTRRQLQAVVLLGAAAAALTVTTFSLAPAARADDFSTLAGDISEIYSMSNSTITAGIADLQSGEIGRLSVLVSGLDNFLLAPEEEFTIGSLDLATGAPVLDPAALTIGLEPEDLNEVLTLNANVLSELSTVLETGLTDLADGNINGGLPDLFAIPVSLLVAEPEFFGLGAIYSLLGL